MRAAAILLIATASAACASVPSGGYVVISDAQGLLRQCSRPAPAHDGTFWSPTEEDIAELERRLPAALAREPQARELGHFNLGTFARQYAGYRRDGRDFIYGNIIPLSDAGGETSWKQTPVIVCDGGPNLFGIEYDVQRRAIVQFTFNGGF